MIVTVNEELCACQLQVGGARHGDAIGRIFKPFLASFSTLFVAGSSILSLIMPPPWTMKPSITRWKIVPF